MSDVMVEGEMANKQSLGTLKISIDLIAGSVTRPG